MQQVLIQSGYLLQGTLCKKTLGAAGGGLIHIIFMEHGSDATNAFLSQCQYTVNYWLLQHGFSIGIGDTVADEATMTRINSTINQVRWVPCYSHTVPLRYCMLLSLRATATCSSRHPLRMRSACHLPAGQGRGQEAH